MRQSMLPLQEAPGVLFSFLFGMCTIGGDQRIFTLCGTMRSIADEFWQTGRRFLPLNVATANSQDLSPWSQWSWNVAYLVAFGRDDFGRREWIREVCPTLAVLYQGHLWVSLTAALDCRLSVCQQIVPGRCFSRIRISDDCPPEGRLILHGRHWVRLRRRIGIVALESSRLLASHALPEPHILEGLVKYYCTNNREP